jgi:formylmethanofuran dehydrogenase subunit D
LKAILITGRSLRQGGAKERKFTIEYREAVTTCEVDAEDFEALGVMPGQNIKLTTRSGSIVLRAVASSQAPHRGIVFVPYGPWANALVESSSDGTGMPTLKGIEVEVQPALEGEILDLKELLRQNLKEK